MKASSERKLVEFKLEYASGARLAREQELEVVHAHYSKGLSVGCAMTPANREWMLKCMRFASWVAGVVPEDNMLLGPWMQQQLLPYEAYQSERLFLLHLIARLKEADGNGEVFKLSQMDRVMRAFGEPSEKDIEKAMINYADEMWEDAKS